MCMELLAELDILGGTRRACGRTSGRAGIPMYLRSSPPLRERDRAVRASHDNKVRSSTRCSLAPPVVDAFTSKYDKY